MALFNRQVQTLPSFKTIVMVKNWQRRIDSTGGWQVLVAQPKRGDKQLISIQGLHVYLGDKVLLEKHLNLYFSNKVHVNEKLNKLYSTA